MIKRSKDKLNLAHDENAAVKKAGGKERVLSAAEDVFAEKGFDGARVDEIAARAGMNKMLIYYHFRSKDQILNAIMIQKSDEITGKIEEFIPDTDNIDNAYIDALIDRFFNYINTQKRFCRIIIAEMMKANAPHDLMFKLFLPFEKALIRRLEQLKIPINDEDELKVKKFFMFEIPLLFFSALGDLYSEYYQQSLDTVRKYISKSFKEIIGGMLQ